jgi:large subunit ribosomal protein L25
MSESFVIEAQPRTDRGKGASRRLRRQNLVPGIIYGAGKDSVAISVVHHELMHQLENEAFYSHILSVKLDGKEEQAILKDLQRHPSKMAVLHLDLQRVSANEAIRVQVPLHFMNEDSCVGVKAGGLVAHSFTDVEVSCLPKDLPEYIELDLIDLDVDQSLHLSDIKLPAGVSLVELMHGKSHDQSVVSIHLPRGAHDEDESDADSAAPAATEEGGEEG